MIYHGDGLEVMKSQKWDHIITDPDYPNQPNSKLYRAQCDGNIILFCDPLKRPEGLDPDEVLFWMKPISTKWSTKRCNRFVEEILIYRGEPSVFTPIHWSSMTGVFTDAFVDKPNHPYAKPISMMEKLVLMYTKPGDLVFDPFCGSGTVGVACKRHGRRYVGVEQNKEFYDLAVSREKLG
jgi:DNA modification methylase